MAFKPAINVEEEYFAAPVDPSMEQPAEQPADDLEIELSPEQMTTLRQLAADQNFEEIGRMIAPLITPAPPVA